MRYNLDAIISQAIEMKDGHSQERRERLRNLLTTTQGGLDAYRSRVNHVLERIDSGCPRNAVIVRVVLALAVQKKTQQETLSIIENTVVESRLTYCELMDFLAREFNIWEHIDLLNCSLQGGINLNSIQPTKVAPEGNFTWKGDPMTGSLNDLGDEKPKYLH